MGLKLSLFYLLKGFFLLSLEQSYSVVQFSDVLLFKFTHFSGMGYWANWHYWRHVAMACHLTAIHYFLIYDDVERIQALLVSSFRSFKWRVRALSWIQFLKCITNFSFRLSLSCTFTHGPCQFQHWVLINIQIGLRPSYSAKLSIPIDSNHRGFFGDRWLAAYITH